MHMKTAMSKYKALLRIRDMFHRGFLVLNNSKNGSGYRIFVLAMLASLMWHLFWLSVITITAPSQKAPIKFSKVSFLGPILGRGSMELRVQPKERSFLEKRYLNEIEISHLQFKSQTKNRSDKYEPAKEFDLLHKDKLTDFIDEAVGGAKLEPAYNIE